MNELWITLSLQMYYREMRTFNNIIKVSDLRHSLISTVSGELMTEWILSKYCFPTHQTYVPTVLIFNAEDIERYYSTPACLSWGSHWQSVWSNVYRDSNSQEPTEMDQAQLQPLLQGMVALQDLEIRWSGETNSNMFRIIHWISETRLD